MALRFTIWGLVALAFAGCGRLSVTGQSQPVECRDFGGKQLCFQVGADGIAVAEGDIVLGEYAELEAKARLGLAISWQSGYWPSTTIAYRIRDSLPNPSRVTKALQHFHQKTRFRFVKQTTETNYIVFRPFNGGYCRSYLGQIGGAQPIDLDTGCGTPQVIHEIGHALGLWHEHNRSDRDQYVRVHWENIQNGFRDAFHQNIDDGEDIGPYDLASIMHYPPFAFSRNGRPTLTRLNGSTSGFGRATGLSPGDVDTLHTLYP